jgi:GT2 family glycosyltransferase
MGLCSIIILTYNALDYTKLCIQSILKHTAYPYELIMVDNGSTDGTLPFLNHVSSWGSKTGSFDTRTGSRGASASFFSYRDSSRYENTPVPFLKYPRRAVVIQNTGNRGFAPGSNQGAASAGGDSLLFLNNDTIVTKNWLQNLHYCLNSQSLIGAVNPCSNFNPYAQVNLPGNNLENLQTFAAAYNQRNPAKWQESAAASGFCLLVKKKAFNQIGGFDEQFQLGCYEDTDLTLRMRLAGYQIIIAWDTFVYHFGNRTFMINGLDLNHFMRENQKRYTVKHAKQ